jgi:hypothetical protein
MQKCSIHLTVYFFRSETCCAPRDAYSEREVVFRAQSLQGHSGPHLMTEDEVDHLEVLTTMSYHIFSIVQIAVHATHIV